METKTRMAIVGCGNISDTYFKNCLEFGLDIVACTDMDMSRAEAKAAQFGVTARPLNKVFADSSIELIINLTPPSTHAEISRAALDAGKHVYSEKPLATNRKDGAQLLELARRKGLRVGCAPDTFLGAGLQTCRKLLDDGLIGEPVAAVAFMTGRGMEMWHPNPDFFYQPGAGPMFDIGPYYLTTLVSMLGPVRRLTGSTRISFPERLITSQPLAGTKIKVNTPTHVTGVLDFVGGPVATVITSFDVWAANLPRLEIYGAEGSLSLPDPNTFGGPVRVKSAKDEEWQEAPLMNGRTEESRGLGVRDMAAAIREGRSHRASAEMAYHVLDLMQSFEEASTSGQHIEIQSRCERPVAL
ncbi:MAG TPA: Gfo/Idh/MocA family oxidoreductase [Anaerolineales bacterium]|nr:Gfo/Idh/MocA family oxidoreductase [Anaerolineales bacterium]